MMAEPLLASCPVAETGELRTLEQGHCRIHDRQQEDSETYRDGSPSMGFLHRRKMPPAAPNASGRANIHSGFATPVPFQSTSTSSEARARAIMISVHPGQRTAVFPAVFCICAAAFPGPAKFSMTSRKNSAQHPVYVIGLRTIGWVLSVRLVLVSPQPGVRTDSAAFHPCRSCVGS